jgi:Domain of unknown function (DUF4349)
MATTNRILPAALLLAALTAAAGCSAGSTTQPSSGGGGAADTVAHRQAADRTAAPSAPTEAGPAAGKVQAAAVPLPRALVRNAELTVRVDDVGAKATRVGGIARRYGGEVYSDSRYGTGAEAKADIVIKVDPERMDGALGEVAALGTEQDRSSSTEDVTEQVADVDSRVASMKASIARVRALLSRAGSIGDLVAVEGELSRRESDLESLQARQRALAGQAALATVTVHLLAKRAPAAPAPARRGFGSGLAGGWHAFTASVGWALTALGAVLPFGLLALLVLVGWRVAATRVSRAARRAPAPPPG